MTPAYSNNINEYLSMIAPNTVNTTSDATTAYYERMLFQRAMSVFKWNIPVTWDYGYFTGVLAVMGYLPIIRTDDYGIIPQCGVAYGRGLFYQPTHVNCISPLVNMPNLKIGTDCEVLRLTPDWCGIWDIVHNFAEKLALCDQAACMSLVNSKVAYVLAAKDKTSAQMLKEIVNRVQSGDPTIIYSEKAIKRNAEDTDLEPWHMFTRDVNASYISDRALADYDSILCMFDEEVGIANLRGAAATKKERLTNDEIAVNNVATSARLRTWCDTLDQTISRVNAFYGKPLINYELRREEQSDDESTDSDT